MGGVDPDNYTSQVLKQIEKTKIDGLKEIIVLLGETAPHLGDIKRQAKTMTIKTKVKANVSNMAEIMANADLAIGAAGATTWERSCLGLPTIQLVIAENQRQIANALAKDYIVLLMGSIQQLPTIVLEARLKIECLIKNASMIVDGQGLERVVKTVMERN